MWFLFSMQQIENALTLYVPQETFFHVALGLNPPNAVQLCAFHLQAT